MRMLRPLLAAVAASLIVACQTTLDTRVDYDRTHDFSNYKSFAWMDVDPVQNARGETAQVSALNRQRIVEAIETELESHGFARTQRADADFVVTYTVGTREQLEATAWPYEYRPYWRYGYGWPMYHGQSRVRSVTEGRLTIDIFDGKTNKPVWSGVAEKQITEAVLRDAASEIPAAVSAVLAQFPPARRSQGISSTFGGLTPATHAHASR